MILMNVSGNLTADAILKNVNGSDLINLSIASNRRYTTKAGEVKEETIFMNCNLWNKPKALPLFFKGRAINVIGYLQVKNYVGSDGILKTAYSVRVSSFQVLGKKQISLQTAENANNLQETNQNLPVTKPLEDLPF